MIEITMPRLSDSMEEGVILSWLVSDGDTVEVGQDIVEIETDKATMEFAADTAGVIHLIAKENDVLPLGAVIARIGEEGETSEREDKEETVETEEESKDFLDTQIEERTKENPDYPDLVESKKTVQTRDKDTERIKASPLAKRIAEEKGVSLYDLKGTGPNGRIVKDDVLAYTDSSVDKTGSSSMEAGKPQETSRIQKLIARRMVQAKEAPHFYLNTRVDMSRIKDFRSTLGDDKPSFNDFIVLAAAKALEDFPRANGHWDKEEEQMVFSKDVNIGIAVAREDALVVPTLKDVNRKGLLEISRDSKDLAKRVREGSIEPAELEGATFTVSNLGMYGVTNFSAIVTPGQAAILAVGSIEDTVVARDGEAVIRPIMEMNLSCDHRILYGADAAEFLAAIKSNLESPEKMLL